MISAVDQMLMMDSAFEAAEIAWWWMELPSGMVMYSPNKLKMLGREKEHYTHYQQFVDIVHPDDKDRIMRDMSDLIEGRADKYETKYRIKHRDGRYMQFYDKGRIVGKIKGDLVIAGFVLKESQANT